MMMTDFYKLLGLEKDTSLGDIQNAYHKLARKEHPDAGGNKERMMLINEAYETLSDPKKKKDFDNRWNAYKTSSEEEDDIVISDHLTSTNILYSTMFEKEHKKHVIDYEKNPLKSGSMTNYFQLFNSNLYNLENKDIGPKNFDDIFSFINAKNISDDKTLSSLLIPQKNVSLKIAIDLFIDFISGNYYGENLRKLKEYLGVEFKKLKSANPNAPELLCYEGIIDILLMSDQKIAEHRNLICSIKKITDFAKKTTESELAILLPLFYNKYFRNLYSYSLHLYWSSSRELFDRSSFDGLNEAKELMKVLRDSLSQNNTSEGLPDLIRLVKLLFILEKDLHDPSSKPRSAEEYREKAFHLLDWIPALHGRLNSQIFVNIFLQIGLHFQNAAELESNSAIQMADEHSACQMYLTGIHLGKQSTPDVEMYAIIQVLKYASALHFQDLPVQDIQLKDIIPILQKRALMLSDVFPFYENTQSNIYFLRQEDRSLHLMRQLLNTLMACIEHNKTDSKTISIDHSHVTVLYQAYEACLKNWYQKNYNPELEKKIRLDLMEELLFEKGWSDLDVEQHLDSPWIMVNRDEEGWLKPSRTLPYKQDSKFTIYSAINGAEINYRNGEINFFLKPYKESQPESEQLFTVLDLQEMLEKNLLGAILSLDPVDPDKPYHPFNAIRFEPSALCESELFNTMLLTDYILKFFTTKQEVQAQYPYEQRPLDKMLAHLPQYLRQIIDRFHKEKHSGEMHRFWIEAEEVDIKHSELENNNMLRIGIGHIQMVVKKHKMRRDVNGQIKDVGNEDEGWPIYVLSATQMEQLEQAKCSIEGHAMIFCDKKNELIYWENNKVVKKHIPQNFEVPLNNLLKQPRESNGKIKISSKNMSLIVRVTKTMALQSELTHRFSPEFIFAHEFTTHYDEFAQYFPEFGRLKEFSKMSALIRYLNGIRQHNLEEIKAIDNLLNSDIHLRIDDLKASKGIKERRSRLERGFESINMAKEDKSIDVKDQCFWVPASVRHEVNTIKSSGRYSFFAYGGVHIQPNLNITRDNGVQLGGNSVGNFNRSQIIQGFQNHHIISNKNPLTQNHPLLQAAGFTNLNSQVNKMYLPTQESQHPTRSIHNGRHNRHYNSDVSRRMDQIYETGKQNNWNQQQYRSQLNSMLSELRQDLKKGNIPLNAKHRPWASI